MKVLIACEFTGTVRIEFERLGHDVWSCDLRADLGGSNRHIRQDVREVIHWGWDLLVVAHPPCTRLCNSGVRWINDPSKIKNLGEDFSLQEKLLWPSLSLDEKRGVMQDKLIAGASLFSDLWNAPVPRVAVENPVMHKHGKTLIRNYEEPTQSVQPWQFGDWETKRTCLWLRGLRPLVAPYPTLNQARIALGLPADAKPEDRVHKTSPGPERSKERSKFFPSIAHAMAEQWGGQALKEAA
jgi:hypothetical protein